MYKERASKNMYLLNTFLYTMKQSGINSKGDKEDLENLDSVLEVNGMWHFLCSGW